jgi:hypothetical protein
MLLGKSGQDECLINFKWKRNHEAEKEITGRKLKRSCLLGFWLLNSCSDDRDEISKNRLHVGYLNFAEVEASFVVLYNCMEQQVTIK